MVRYPCPVSHLHSTQSSFRHRLLSPHTMYMNSSRSQTLRLGTARLQPSEDMTCQMSSTAATRDGGKYGQVLCSTPERCSRNTLEDIARSKAHMVRRRSPTWLNKRQESLWW